MYELKDTVELMTSEDYKERFKAEYRQLFIRYQKLKAFNNKIEAALRTDFPVINGEVKTKVAKMPAHDCPPEMLREQQRIMGEYLHVLEVRAEIEEIDLWGDAI